MSDTSPRGRFVWYDLMTTDPAGAMDFYMNVAGWAERFYRRRWTFRKSAVSR
jgi:predicted enzyme related to lactoylglutathione lyase